MVIDTASDHKPSPKPIDSPTKTKPAATDTSFPVAAAADSTVMSEQYEDESSKQEVEESQSPYNPPHPASDSGSGKMCCYKLLNIHMLFSCSIKYQRSILFASTISR